MLQLEFLKRQREFSLKAFGAEANLPRHIKHLLSELEEVRENPLDILEYADLYIISLDIAMRSGATPERVYRDYFHVVPKEVSAGTIEELIKGLTPESELSDYLLISRTIERLAEQHRVTNPILAKAIDLKLEVNMQRTFKLDDSGHFHHVDPDSPIL